MKHAFRVWTLLPLLILMACESFDGDYPAGYPEPGALAASDASGGASGSSVSGSSVVQDARGRSVVELADVTDKSAATAGRQQAAATAPERFLVQRGELSLEVPRPEDAVQSIVQRLREWEGYLQQQAGTSLTIRVPAARFDSVFATIRGMGRLLSEVRSADDVTEEFLDLGLRIENAKRSLERLRELLERTAKVEELLRVEQEMRRLSEEIERLEGRRRLMASQVAMATLKVSFRATSEPPVRPRLRQPSRFPWLNAIGPENLLEIL